MDGNFTKKETLLLPREEYFHFEQTILQYGSQLATVFLFLKF